MPIKKLSLTLNAAYLAFAPTLSFAVFSQAYPTKQIGIIAPFATGGGTDIIVRSMADPLSKQWRHFDGKAGGGSVGALKIIKKNKVNIFMRAQELGGIGQIKLCPLKA